MRRRRTGWVTDSSVRRIFPLPWDRLSSVGMIRYAGLAQVLARQSPYAVERYKPWRSYEVVIFVKRMGRDAERLAEDLKKKGTKIIFDANVNYYEEWGDFSIPGTRPTDEQRRSAVAMTQLADAVIADSSYLAEQCKKFNPNTTWIPDGVNTTFFSPLMYGKKPGPLTLIWSGMGKKAHHLKLIVPALCALKNKVRLILVSSASSPDDAPAGELEYLCQNVGAEIRYWDYRLYRNWLNEADIIISPKDLTSSYEMAHTEYKISLGMAMGLPALASPQPSYVDALGDSHAGYICHGDADWLQGLEHYLSHPEDLKRDGLSARRQIEDRYAFPVLAKQLQGILDSL